MDIFFSGWHELGRALVVGCLSYVGIIALLRVTGKRALAKMDAYDPVVTIALGSTLAIMILSSQVKLKRHRLTPEEIKGAVRAHGYAGLEAVGAVVLEPDGSFSVIPRSRHGSGTALSNVTLFPPSRE